MRERATCAAVTHCSTAAIAASGESNATTATTATIAITRPVASSATFA